MNWIGHTFMSLLIVFILYIYIMAYIYYKEHGKVR